MRTSVQSRSRLKRKLLRKNQIEMLLPDLLEQTVSTGCKPETLIMIPAVHILGKILPENRRSDLPVQMRVQMHQRSDLTQHSPACVRVRNRRS